MDMVNDGKDIRLDTPQAVKEALASGKDLYNPQTGEFWWEYNYTGSIANTYVHLDDPNLLAVVDNPDFDLYEDIVGGLNYTGYITDSIETIIEDGWVIASPENVRKAVQSHMAENGADAPEGDATEPGSFDRAIECHQLHSTRGMPGDDRITLGGEAQAMKAASAEMADGAGKHDIGLDAR